MILLSTITAVSEVSNEPFRYEREKANSEIFVWVTIFVYYRR